MSSGDHRPCGDVAEIDFQRHLALMADAGSFELAVKVAAFETLLVTTRVAFHPDDRRFDADHGYAAGSSGAGGVTNAVTAAVAC